MPTLKSEVVREAWSRDLGGSFPTLGATLAHLVSAEWIWVQRWMGTNPTQRPAWVDTPPSASRLRTELAAVEADRRVFLDGLSDEALQRPFAYTLLSGAEAAQPLRDVLLHVVNHSTYHRGQAAAMLRRLGQAPPATDYLVYATSAHVPTAG